MHFCSTFHIPELCCGIRFYESCHHSGAEYARVASAPKADEAREEAQSGFATYGSVAEIPHATMQQCCLPNGHGDVASRGIVKVRRRVVLVPVRRLCISAARLDFH
jgi:hypothetical protein